MGMPWRYRVLGELGHVTRKRREIIATMRAAGERIGRIAEAVDLDERKVRYHLRRLRDAGDERAAAGKPGRPRSCHA